MDDKSEDISEAIGAKETARLEKKFIQAQNKLKKCEEAARLSEKELYNLPLGKIASRGRVTLNLLEPWSDDNNENYLLYEGEANTPEIRMGRLERCYGDKKTWELDHLRCMSIYDQAVSTWLRLHPITAQAVTAAAAWPKAQALTSCPNPLMIPSVSSISTVTVDPHRGERFLILACGAASRVWCGMSAANARIRPEYSLIRSVSVAMVAFLGDWSLVLVSYISFAQPDAKRFS